MIFSPFNFLLAGLVVFFSAGLITAWYAGDVFWILARLVAGSLFLGAFLLALVQGKFPREHQRVVQVFLLVMVYMIALGIPNFIQTFGLRGFRSALAADFVSIGMLAFGVTLLSLNSKQLTLTFKWMMGLSVGLFILLLPQMDVSAVTEAGSRAAAGAALDLSEDRSAYHFQMGLTAIYFCLFLASFGLKLHARWRFVAVASLSFVVIVALFYSKRSVLLNLGLVLAIFFVVNVTLAGHFAGTRRFRIVGIGVLALIAAIAGAFFFKGNIDVMGARLFERFDEFEEVADIAEFSRIIEVRYLWDTSPLNHRLLGGGPLLYHFSAATGRMSNTLHIGWANLYFKGGPVLLLFFGWMFWRNIRMALFSRNRPSFLVGATLPLFLAFSMAHSTVWGSLFSGFAVALALFLYPALYHLESRGLRSVSIKTKQHYRDSRSRKLDPRLTPVGSRP